VDLDVIEVGLVIAHEIVLEQQLIRPATLGVLEVVLIEGGS
jgi:hypothetical protein